VRFFDPGCLVSQKRGAFVGTHGMKSGMIALESSDPDGFRILYRVNQVLVDGDNAGSASYILRYVPLIVQLSIFPFFKSNER
jgi:hypothetical protein